MFFLYGMISVEAVSVNRKPAVHKSGYYAIRHELLFYTVVIDMLYGMSYYAIRSELLYYIVRVAVFLQIFLAFTELVSADKTPDGGGTCNGHKE